ncbi:MAG: hypothetical protein QXP81_01450 [Nitrososphaerota archaeon]
MDRGPGPYFLLVLLALTSVAAGVIADQVTDGVLLDVLVASRSTIASSVPVAASEETAASVGSAVQVLVTGEAPPPGSTETILKWLESPFRALGILANNLLPITYVLIAYGLGEALSKRTRDVRFSKVGSALSLGPLPINGFTAGLVLSTALREVGIEATSLLSVVPFSELIALSLVLIAPAARLTAGTRGFGDLLGRLPLAVLLLAFSASIESWFISLT